MVGDPIHLVSDAVSGAFGVAVNPAGTFAYVTNQFDTSVSVIALDPPTAARAISAAVPDVLQAVGRPSTGCATYASTGSVNLGSVVGTGWNPSWAQWPNNDLGCDVCVRILGYNMTTGNWLIR